MSDLPVTNSPASNEPVIREAPANTGSDISISQAARALQAARKKPTQEAAPAKAAEPAAPATDTETPTAESADTTATAANELPDEGNAATGENQSTGETDGKPDPAAKPPLPLPRSWTKEQADHWNALPRTTQEFLTEQASKNSAEVRRVQNEAAEKSKVLTAKEQAAEQTRTQLESKLKSVVEVLEKEQLRDFPEIRSQADLDKLHTDAAQFASTAARLAESDPLGALQAQMKWTEIQDKLGKWNVHQQKLAFATNEAKQADERKSKERSESWTKHIQEQNKLAAEKIPDLADKDKAPALMKRAAERLSELGFTQDEVGKLTTGAEKISIYDHRLQQLIFSDLRLSELLKAPKAVAAKPVPPVQRPGTPAPRGSVQSETIKSLTSKLNNSGSLKDAVALRQAQQRAQRRAT